MKNPIIIIGAGLAGWSTLRELRKLNLDIPVILITADNGDFYAKPSLSNAFTQKRTPAQLVTTSATKMKEMLNVTLITDTRLLSIDPVEKLITTTQSCYHYSKLVLAMGAKAISVPIEGDASDQIRSINSLDDFSLFYTQITKINKQEKLNVDQRADQSVKHVLILGAGLLGCEFSNDLVASGYQVTVVDPADRAIASLLPVEASSQLQEALKSSGVSWHFGTTVKSINTVESSLECIDFPLHGDALRVELVNGNIIFVDMVLSAIGLTANTTVARSAGLICDRAIVVDVHLETSAPDIYALGDSAQYASGVWQDSDATSVSDGRILPYVMPLMCAAKALANTLAGVPTSLTFPLMPVTIKTPVLPIVVALPALGISGTWENTEDGVWHFIDLLHQIRGFALAGRQTARRSEQSKLVVH